MAEEFAPFGLAPADIDPMTGVPLTPSDYAQGKFQRIATAVGGGLKNWVETPGKTLWGSAADNPLRTWGDLAAPATPSGSMTEEEAFRQNKARDTEADWGAGTAFGMLGVGTPAGMLAKPGQVGVFGGKLAKTADTAALARAEEMTAGGAGRDAVWHQTGWFKGADDKWRFEIPDENVGVFGISPHDLPSSTQEIGKLSTDLVSKQDRGVRVGDVMQHPDLYAAYPSLPDKYATVYPMEGGSRGAYDRGSGNMYLDSGLDPWDAKSVALHEAQHAIQGSEGFATGASPKMFQQQADAKLARDAMSLRREFDRLPAGMDRSAKENLIRENYKDAGIEDWLPSREAWDVAHDRIGNPDDTLQKVVKLYGLDKSVTPARDVDLYRRSAGEVEARNVQARKDMTDYERKMSPPWKTEDVPPADQIVLANGDMTFGSMAPMESSGQRFKSIGDFMDHWSGQGVRNFVADRPTRGQIQLSDLVVPQDKRGQGLGTKFMQDLTQFADENGRMLTLTAARDYGSTSLPRLKEFYKRFGFVENKGRNKDFSISDNMYRPKGGS